MAIKANSFLDVDLSRWLSHKPSEPNPSVSTLSVQMRRFSLLRGASFFLFSFFLLVWSQDTIVLPEAGQQEALRDGSQRYWPGRG